MKNKVSIKEITAKHINSSVSLEKRLKEIFSEHTSFYKNKKIPGDHMLVFIDFLLDKARKTNLEDQEAFIKKLLSIRSVVKKREQK